MRKVCENDIIQMFDSSVAEVCQRVSASQAACPVSIAEGRGVLQHLGIVMLAIGIAWPIIIPICLFLCTDWQPLHEWYGCCYLIFYIVCATANFFVGGNWAILTYSCTYFCSKLTGIILLCWLRWGYHATWMSGSFGYGLIVILLIGYIIGVIVYPLWAIPVIRSIIKVFTWIQDTIMRNSLNCKLLHAYYKPPTSFLEKMEKKYNCQGQLLKTNGGTLEGHHVERIASDRIYHHALIAAAITFLCALPQGWITWPLVAVDTILYQRQIFRVSQEMAMLYWPTSRPDFPKFDYMTLANIVMKIEGDFIGRQSKSVVGWMINWLVKKIPIFVHGPLLYFFAHMTKWFGIVVTREMVSNGLDYLVIMICGLVAATITFWIFFPAAKRCKNYFGYGDTKTHSAR